MTRLLSPILARVAASQGYGLMFYCPGCKEEHAVWAGEGDKPRWGYNNNPEKSTFTPSILIRSGHFASHWKPGGSCWCTWAAEEGEDPGFSCGVCHSFVTDGVIQFLSDCTHALAGQSVPLPIFPRGEFMSAKPSPYPPRKEKIA